MGTFDQLGNHLLPYQPLPPVWRMQCTCSFQPGRPGQVAACECGYWWRAGKRGRWHAISVRRAFRVLLPELIDGLGRFELTGDWPAD
jgi:hypothetical protein